MPSRPPGPRRRAVPELPEVETIRRGLERELRGTRIDAVDHRTAKRLRSLSPTPLERLEGQRVLHVRRHGKFLLVELDSGTMVVHLGMTGKLLFAQAEEPERPHTHLVLELDDGRLLRFSDPRRFGALRLYPKGVPVADVAGFGPDALGPGFTPAYLAQQLAASRAPLKAFLMDQRRIAGLGNIYVCEALWRSRLSPRRTARTTPKAKVPELHAAIREVLEDSLAQGGTSFNDYVDHIGQPGKFVLSLAVYGREGEACPRCGATIRRIVQSGRSTFDCPTCQR